MSVHLVPDGLAGERVDAAASRMTGVSRSRVSDLIESGGVLLIMTRWHDDDLAGRLLRAQARGEGDTWEVVEYPAIALQDEVHRRAGEPLHPERFR